jgi:hypothetical protein
VGTLTHSYGKRYGYRGHPGTCRWCGDKLRHERVMADESDKADPTYREERGGWATVLATKAGAYQDDLFCSLRCGYQWAIARLRKDST